MAKTIFTAAVETQNGLTMKCKSRDFEFILDEPAELGGNNTGMNPIEALLNALGACKAIVARSFAPVHGVEFTNLKIKLEGTLDPAGFTGMDPDAKIGLSHIKTTYIFQCEESPEKIKEFVEFIDKTCPVMDSIVNAPSFEEEIQII